MAPRALRSRIERKYSAAAVPRLLYVHALGLVFSAFWAVYRRLIVTSPMNKHEVFLSVRATTQQAMLRTTQEACTEKCCDSRADSDGQRRP
jgi:hypothetical protein